MDYKGLVLKRREFYASVCLWSFGGSGEDCALAIVMSSDECSHLLALGSPGKTPSSSQGQCMNREASDIGARQ
ncbi:hypothetical protein NC652_039198 [Populus alba x Populus x berolinensis]|nr:hypothetical protein NC652_039198 [Populus alba x Populus x berolinensis]